MLKTFKEIFQENQISPSYNRTRIYALLETSNEHPTVDMIYKELKEELPTLSKTTVYNVLNLFIEKGIVKLVNMNGAESRYEIYHEEHSHFKCDECGTIYDIPKIKADYRISELKGFEVKENEVNLTGICPNCL
jgi:Fe2+ or Zn2+ uptake regulation protein